MPSSATRNPGPGLRIHLSVAMLVAAFILKAAERHRQERRRIAVEGRLAELAALAQELADDRGRAADRPSEIPRRGWKDILWRVYEEISDDRLLAVAAGVTFYVLLAIFPTLAAVVSFYGLAADPATIGDHLDALYFFLPSEAVQIIAGQVARITARPPEALGLTAAVGLAVSLWSSNAAMKAIFDALNVVYDEREKRGFIRLTLETLAFTLGAIAFLLAAIGAVVVLPVALGYVGMAAAAERLVSLLRWPALAAILFIGLAALYRYGPSRAQARWRWLSPGSAVATAGWLAVSILFSWYVANFANYNETYGSLGAAIGFMTWIWLSAIVVLVGAEINAETEHQTARDSTVGPDLPLGRRGATMADTVGARRGDAGQSGNA